MKTNIRWIQTIIFVAGVFFCLQLAARYEIIHVPTGGTSFTERWQWAMDAAARQSNGDFWVGFSIERMMPENQYIFSNGNTFIFMNQSTPDFTDDAPSLQGLLSGTPVEKLSEAAQLRREAERALAAKKRKTRKPVPTVRKEMAFLFEYSAGSSARHDFHAIHIHSVELSAGLDKNPLFWLGKTTPGKSVPLLTQLYNGIQTQRLKERMISVVALHEAPEQVVPFLEKLLLGNSRKDIRETAASRLGWQNHPDALKALIAAGKNDRSSDVRAEAVESIGEMEIDGVVDALIDFARHAKTLDVRVEAIEALGEKNVSDGNVALEKIAFEDRDEEARIEAVEAIAGQETPQSQAFLKKVINKHPNAEIRAEAVDQLFDQPDEKLGELLENIALTDPSEDVQEEAIDALAEWRDKSAAMHLIAVYQKHSNSEIREEAIEQLAEIAADRAVATLEKTISDSRTLSLKVEALEALAEMDNDAGILRLIEIAKTSPDQRIRKKAIELLGESDDRQAHDAVIEIVKKSK